MYDGEDCEKEIPDFMHFSITFGDYIFSMLGRKSSTKHPLCKKISRNLYRTGMNTEPPDLSTMKI